MGINTFSQSPCFDASNENRNGENWQWERRESLLIDRR